MTMYAEHITEKQVSLIAALRQDIANSKRRACNAKKRDDWDKFHAEGERQDELYARLDVVESPVYLHWTAIRTTYLECLRQDGMAVWQEMAQHLGVTIRDLDYQFGELLYKGLCSIEHHEYAYPAYGLGFRGRKEYQLVTLRFIDPVQN